MRHVGDHPTSDYAIPLKLGIKAELFTEVRLTTAERNVLEISGEPQAGSRISAAMRGFRLGEDTSNNGINQLVSEFVAPFVMAYAVWVLRRAQEAGLKRLYFLSRDCQLVWKSGT